jgi:hypothetical protein
VTAVLQSSLRIDDFVICKSPRAVSLLVAPITGGLRATRNGEAHRIRAGETQSVAGRPRAVGIGCSSPDPLAEDFASVPSRSLRRVSEFSRNLVVDPGEAGGGYEIDRLGKVVASSMVATF